MVCIRAARLDDLEDLVALYTELTKGKPVLSGAVGRARLEEILSHPGTTILGAEVEGHLVSVATLHLCPNLTMGGRPYGRVENVVTLARHRGQGLARRVVEAVQSEARKHNAVSLILLTGKALSARPFYESLGFDAEEKWGMIWRPAPGS